MGSIYTSGIHVVYPVILLVVLALIRRVCLQFIFPKLFAYRWAKMDEDRRDKRVVQIMSSFCFLGVFCYATPYIWDSIFLRHHDTSYYNDQFRYIIPSAFACYLFETISDRFLALGGLIHHVVTIGVGCMLYLETAFYEPIMLFGYFASMDFPVYFCTNMAFLVQTVEARVRYLKFAAIVYPFVFLGRAVVTFAYVIYLWVTTSGQDTPIAVLLLLALFVFLYAEFQFEKWMIVTIRRERARPAYQKTVSNLDSTLNMSETQSTSTFREDMPLMVN